MMMSDQRGVTHAREIALATLLVVVGAVVIGSSGDPDVDVIGGVLVGVGALTLLLSTLANWLAGR